MVVGIAHGKKHNTERVLVTVVLGSCICRGLNTIMLPIDRPYAHRELPTVIKVISYNSPLVFRWIPKVDWLDDVPKCIAGLMNNLADCRVSHTKVKCQGRTRCPSCKISDGYRQSEFRWNAFPHVGVALQYVRLNKRQELFESPFVHPQIFMIHLWIGFSLLNQAMFSEVAILENRANPVFSEKQCISNENIITPCYKSFSRLGIPNLTLTM